jgi:Kef-type K+ transport system membrane component KefB
MAIESGCTALVVGVISAAVLTLVPPAGEAVGGNILRNAVIIGACAAVSAPTGARLMAQLGLLDARGARQLRRVAALDDVMALLAVALVTAAFRPIGDSAWQLPPLGWVFLQVGMGVGLGLLVWVAVRNARNPNEDVAMTLGALAFAAGMAGYVGFSPLVVCFVSGMTVANVPGDAAAGSWLSRPRFRDLERPIYMAFFVVVGALWSPSDRRGWIMLPIYVLARAAGKLLGVRAARAALAESAEGLRPDAVRLGPTASTWLAFLPSSAVSIAVVVSARSSYPELLHGSLETVVIGGALLSELVFRVSARALAGHGASGQESPVGALSIDHDNLDDERPAATSTPPAVTPTATPGAPATPTRPPR